MRAKKIFEDEEWNPKWIKPAKDIKEKILKKIEGRKFFQKFEISIEYNQVWLVKELLSKFGVEWESPYVDFMSSLFRFAAQNGYLEIVKILCENTNEVNLTSMENFAIRYAVIENHIETVKYLLNYPKVDPSDKNNQALKNINIYDKNYRAVIDILLKDERVIDKLSSFERMNLISEGFDI